MSTEKIERADRPAADRPAGGRLRRGLPAALTAALALTALAGTGQAVAAARPDGTGTPSGAQRAAGIISTVAGGVGGPAAGTKVALSHPCGVSFANGHLYIADTEQVGSRTYGAAIREMSPASSLLTTPVGNHAYGKFHNGVLATTAYFSGCDTTVDHSGNLVISDDRDQRIEVVPASTGTFYGQAMTAGHIYSIAGDGKHGFSGDGGPATSAELSFPGSVRVDARGNLVIADTFNYRVRVVAASTGSFYGQAMTAGDIYTIAGDGSYNFNGDFIPATSAGLSCAGIKLDAAGNVLIADGGNARLRLVAASTGTFYGQAMTAGDIYTIAGDGAGGFSGDGGPATSAETVPSGVNLDHAGNVLIADSGNERIRVVAVTTGKFYGRAMTAADIYTIAGDGSRGFSGDGGPATSAELSFPAGPAVDSTGNVVIADVDNFRVRVVAAVTGKSYGQAMTAGDIYTVAGTGGQHFSGDGGPATSAELYGPGDVAADAAGDVLISEFGNYRVRMVAGVSGIHFGKAMTAGDIYTVAGDGNRNFSGDGGPATKAGLTPEAVTVDQGGNAVICDEPNSRVRVVAEKAGRFYGQTMTAGDIYTVAGDGVAGFSGDGGPATKAELQCSTLAVDPAGNLVIGDFGRIRVVAASTGTFYGQAMTAGDIYTIAGQGVFGFSGDGGPALHALLTSAGGIAFDATGNLVFTDFGNLRVRVIAEKTGTFYGQAMTADDIYTVAGDGTRGFAGDGGPATSAEFASPDGLAIDGAGNLVIADASNNRVRVVAESTGTFYGVAMTAGDVYTVAGNKGRQFSGDGGPATKASLFSPDGVTVTSAGNLVIADGGNNRIRQVTG